jgi:NRPS condensation-like uncharacterized protein
MSIPDTIPAAFPTTIIERFLPALYAQHGDIMIQMVLGFERSLDAGRLRTAFRLILDEVPILGCRFGVAEDGMPVWKRLGKDECDNFIVAESEADHAAHLNASVKAAAGPLVKGVLLRRHRGDTLLIKFAHEATDAAGAKEIVRRISRLYGELRSNPSLRPIPVLDMNRSVETIIRRFPRSALVNIGLRAMKELLLIALHKRSVNSFHSPVSEKGFEYLTRTIDPACVADLKREGARRAATLNDMLLCAFIRAVYFIRAVGRDAATLRCMMPVDLRKWYPDEHLAGSITNLSLGELLHFGKGMEPDFSDTLRRVVALTGRRKRNYPGFGYHAAVHYIARNWSFEKTCAICINQYRKDIRAGFSVPIFTNMGPLVNEHLLFDDFPASAHILGPVNLPPQFGMGVTSYGGALTLSTSVYAETREKVGEIMDRMIGELQLQVEKR